MVVNDENEHKGKKEQYTHIYGNAWRRYEQSVQSTAPVHR